MIKISVVIPMFNKEKEIANTIKSVLNQTYKADEIIVIDDGSTDNSAKIVEKFTQVKLIKQKNIGETATRNRGIKEAKNEYICFLDGDDLWEANFLEEIKKLIEKFPNNLFYSTSYKLINENGNIIYSKIPFDRNFIGEIDLFKYFKDYYGIINSSSVCIKKSSELLFPEGEKKGGDLCMWIQLSLKSKLGFSAKALSIYKLNASNRSVVIQKEGVVPCQLKWLYKNKKYVNENIKKFIYKNILITVYGLALANNYSDIKKIIEFMKEYNDLFRILLYPSFFIPKFLIEFVKKIRRKFF